MPMKQLFEDMGTLGHERVLFCSNPDVGLRAIIAVHSTVLGPGLGGVRMWPFHDLDEALRDVLRLSRGMTYKAAAAGLALGGGKAVILGDPRADKSEALLRCFGRYVDELGGLYITAEDVGTDVEDMELINQETRWVTGVSPAHGGGGDPSPVTALGVLQGIRAAVERCFGSDGLRQRSVAIQGLGNVGHHLAALLHKEGAMVLGCDPNPEHAERAASESGVGIVPVEQIYDTECDVFAPCALGAVLNDQTVPRLRCRIVAGSANNQLDDEARHAAQLEARGILYAPDFVINAGGLINVYNELAGPYNRQRALRMALGIRRSVSRVFEIAGAQGITTHAAAGHLAEERIRSMQGLRAHHWGRFIPR